MVPYMALLLTDTAAKAYRRFFNRILTEMDKGGKFINNNRKCTP
jgi:hypothetical protein